LGGEQRRVQLPRLSVALIGGLAVLAPVGASSAIGSSPRRPRTIPLPAVNRWGTFAGTSTAAAAQVRDSVVTPPGTAGAPLGAPLAPASTSARPMVLGDRAAIIDAVAYAPVDAPIQVKRAIWAGNQIRLRPYVYAGGHGSFISYGYDCSGSVSYVLHAARLLDVTMDSSEFETWGKSGVGRWITVYTNPGHAFVQIAGIRFDTSAAQDPNPPPGTGPRWRPLMQSTAGFMPRHPVGL
jgi:hypothetical protein